MQLMYGSGSLFGTRTDIANPTPVQFGVIQDVQIDFSFSTKELMGQYQAPIAVARGAMKITGKTKAATIRGRAFNDIFFGQTLSPGQQATALNEGPTAIPASPYSITVANSMTFVADLGVINAATGIPMVAVASAPAAGQYSLAAGVYTFSSADEASGISVQISYTYTIASTGNRIVAANQLMGAAPAFQVSLYGTYQGKQATMVLPQCVSTKLSLAFKNEDFMIPEFDFSAYANEAGTFFDISTVE